MLSDIILAFSLYNIIIWGFDDLINPIQGFPLALASIATSWYCNILPEETYTITFPNPIKISVSFEPSIDEVNEFSVS